MVVEVAEKKEFCSYYTNNDTILKYMIKQIDVDGVKILEPCGGGGAFIDAILDFNKSAIIDTLDCNPDAANNLKKKYKNFSKVKVWQGDTLFDTTLDQNSNSYDSIIGNPPYGVWQDNDRRIKLKKKYPNCYVKESYTMFLIRCLSLLKNNGKLCFIIPDTFLYLHRHEKLRKMLLRMTIIDSILIFPSKLFPEVNFGYAKLSIISLKKSNNYDFNLSNKVKIYNQVNNERDIDGIINKNNDKYILKTQSEILDNASSAFEFSSNGLNVEKLKEIENVISDFANCVTGIYTGNNIKYIKRLNDRVKNSKGYENINSNGI